jgi:hypothetical protein
MAKGPFYGRTGSYIIAAAIAALVLLLCYGLVHQTTSPLVSVAQGLSDLSEGFQSVPSTSPKCPGEVRSVDGTILTPAYKFYTDATGESLCCGGTVNPLTHTCTPATSTVDQTGGLCAFRPGVPDPRTSNQTLPLCAFVVDAITTSNGTTVCPPSLSKYAASATQQSCCKTATNLDGTDCIKSDLDRGTFCRVSPPVSSTDPDCAAMRTYETAVCPPTLQKTSYKMGTKEVNAYSAANGVSAPLCFGVEGSCFPDDTVANLQTKGIFTREPADPTTWKFACSGYAKYQSGVSSNVKTTYLTPPPAS